MKIETSSLYWYHFLVSWFLCLATGVVLQSLYMFLTGDSIESFAFALLTAGVALVLSSPFIVLFCIIVHFHVLKKERSRAAIHQWVFLWHFVGTVFVFLGMLVFLNSEMRSGGGEIILILLGYFTIDSIYFHLFIHKKANKISEKDVYLEDLLDR